MRYDNEIDRWWFSQETKNMPGAILPFFGAGVSIDPPTALPSGQTLTTTLMQLLLSEMVSNDLLALFAKHENVLGQRTLRLEHLLSVATNANPQAAHLLDIFRDATPNRNHHILAEHLTQRRSWAVTTNFDECVEQASDWSIPVHVFDPSLNDFRILYGPQNADWGLIKLHGTIGDGADRLASTIERLSPGLAAPVQRLLDRVFSDANFVVVAGYSGSDHFDVNRYLQAKLGQSFRAHILWIQHGGVFNSRAIFPSSTTAQPSPQSRGPDAFQSAFNGAKSFSGNTPELLDGMFGGTANLYVPATSATTWADRLTTLYQPTRQERYRTDALLGAAMGIAEMIDVSLPSLRDQGDYEFGLLLEATSMELKGYWATARKILRRHQYVTGELNTNLIASNLRRSGKPVRALFRLRLLGGITRRWEAWRPLFDSQAPQPRRLTARTNLQERRMETINCILDSWRVMRKARAGRTKAISWLFCRSIEAHSKTIEKLGLDLSNAVTEADWQLIQLQAIAFGTYCDNDRDAGWLWQVIEAEMASPDFYTDRGPLVAGFYLNPAVTNSELDRVARLFEVRLHYADALVAWIQNNYLDRHKPLLRRIIKPLFGEEKHAQLLRQDLYWQMHISAALAKSQFRKAYETALMLDSDEIYGRLSLAWLAADRAISKFRTWERQRTLAPPWRLPLRRRD